MSETKSITPPELANELGIEKLEFENLLIAIGFAQIGNEAQRQALISGHKIPSKDHYKKVIEYYFAANE